MTTTKTSTNAIRLYFTEIVAGEEIGICVGYVTEDGRVTARAGIEKLRVGERLEDACDNVWEIVANGRAKMVR